MNWEAIGVVIAALALIGYLIVERERIVWVIPHVTAILAILAVMLGAFLGGVLSQSSDVRLIVLGLGTALAAAYGVGYFMARTKAPNSIILLGFVVIFLVVLIGAFGPEFPF